MSEDLVKKVEELEEKLASQQKIMEAVMGEDPVICGPIYVAHGLDINGVRIGAGISAYPEQYPDYGVDKATADLIRKRPEIQNKLAAARKEFEVKFHAGVAKKMREVRI